MQHTVTGPFVNYEWTTCRDCHESYHLKCLSPPLEHRPNKWRCQLCRDTKKKVPREKIVAKPKNEKLFEGVHDDDCYICFNGGGKLVCLCSSCIENLYCHAKNCSISFINQTCYAVTIAARFFTCSAISRLC